LLQRGLLRMHSERMNWPEAYFFTEKALPAFDEALKKSTLNIKNDILISFFWWQEKDFKVSMANMPVLCALWAASDIPLDWWHDPTNRLGLHRLRSFDPLWFDEAYRHAFSACIGLGIVTTPTVAECHCHFSINKEGIRTYRVPAGTVERIRARKK
jgi:hypothetical protein